MTLDSHDRDEARKVFRAAPHFLNCAQSVASLAGADAQVDGLAGYGGGRAPGGLCGALHAALELVPPSRRDDLLRDFEQAVGNQRCADIKRENRTPCLDCVAIATQLARRYRD
ncbi:MAG: hypothetical protein ACI4WT_01085 [Oligosphaeraceae bacterium]